MRATRPGGDGEGSHVRSTKTLVARTALSLMSTSLPRYRDIVHLDLRHRVGCACWLRRSPWPSSAVTYFPYDVL